MDCWTGKELERQPHSKSYSQWLDVRVETSDKWCPPRLHRGPTLSNVFIDMDSGTQRTVSRGADNTRLSGAAYTSGGQVQPEGPGQA